MINKIITSLVLSTVFVLPVSATIYEFPENDGFVTDIANVIDEKSEYLFESMLLDYKKTNGIEIAILTIPSLDGAPIEDYSIKLARKWGIGQSEEDSGILFLVAVNDRQMRIEVGYGLEGALTDLESARINSEVATYFRLGDYDKGISQAADLIIKATEEEHFENSNSTLMALESEINIMITLIAIALQVIIIWSSSVMARSKSIHAGGILGGITGTIIVVIGWIGLITLIIIPIGIVFGLILDFVLSKGYRSRKNPPWWMGGKHNRWFDSIGKGGFGGGGFGGFGGGGFGGGGASGRW